MPFPVVLSAPSGVGKTTIARSLMQRRTDVGYSVSCTTRAPRPGEENGKDYYFLSDDEFVARIGKAEFAESAFVHGRRYGTLRSEVQRVLDSGKHVLMDIDVQGAAQFVKAFPESVLIFVIPPSLDELVERLKRRNTESDAQLAERLRNAHTELQDAHRYHWVVVNDALERAIEDVATIIDAEQLKRDRVHGLDEQVSGLLRRLEDQLTRYSSSSAPTR
jgi:guanylate kinase